ncbi:MULTISPECIES: TorF family putative porin [Gammaproteobacteria]|uniref:TorF family putative porin n=1 Tax=Gammaproteobacteria TaxID=1236 RepID=UPI0011283BAA|nr:TorF family putative porin [Pseudomonas sp. Hp2]
MKSSTLACALLLALSSVSTAAFAQEEGADEYKPFSATLAVTTDYVWRGISQTNEDPAFQAGATYTSKFGLYAGAWTSNVDFGEGDPDWERDYYIGYNTDFGDKVNFDVMVNRYTYSGASDLNWNELITKTTFLETYSLTLAYSNDSWATSEDGYYAALAGNWSLPHDFTIGASYGRSMFSNKAGIEDYSDYSVSVGKSFGPLALSVAYIDTDKAGERVGGSNGGDRVVVTATIGL